MLGILKIILGLILLFIIFYFLYKISYFFFKEKVVQDKSKDLKFLLIKIPLKWDESEQRADNIQAMKQNIEIMNQVVKSFSSIYSSDFKDKHFLQNYISLEILVEKEVIKYILGIPKEYVDIFEKMISSFYPGAVIDEIYQPKLLGTGMFMYWWTFALSKEEILPIKTYENFEADPMDSLLSSFSRVDWDEKLSLQILLMPLGEGEQKEFSQKAENSKKDNSWWGIFSKIFWLIFQWNEENWENSKEESSNKYSSSQSQDIDKKVEEDLYEVVIKAFSVSGSPDRSKKIINDMKRSFSQYSYTWLNSLKFVPAKNIEKFAKNYIKRMFVKNRPLWKRILLKDNPDILNLKEITSIYHFPHSRFNKNPRIKWQKFKISPAPDNLPKEGLLLWQNLYSGVKKDVKISYVDRFRHFYTIGQTGTWKSTMLLLQAKQDVQNGKWLTLIDPHGDLTDDLLKFYPKERVDDLIYIDASDFEMPVWINIFEAKDEKEMDIIVNDAVDMFTMMFWPEIFWPRLVDYFRNAALALMEQPEWGTLPEIVRIFTDEAFQKTKLKNVKNPVIRAWWEKTYAAMWDREKAEAIPFFQAKFGPFITTPIIRNIIGQQESSFDFYQAMQEWKVILLNLSKWKMWEVNSSLLWTMVVSKLKAAALRRAELPLEERTEHFLYIDEFQNFVTPSIETILSEARKYRLGLVLAHQYLDQLEKRDLGWDTDLKSSIFGNIGTMMAYKVGAPDAEKLEQEFSPEFSRSDLINMDKFKWIMKLSVDTQPSRPFSVSVQNPFEDDINTKEKVNILKEISRLRRWRKRDLVEKEIYYRVGV